MDRLLALIQQPWIALVDLWHAYVEMEQRTKKYVQSGQAQSSAQRGRANARQRRVDQRMQAYTQDAMAPEFAYFFFFSSDDPSAKHFFQHEGRLAALLSEVFKQQEAIPATTYKLLDAYYHQLHAIADRIEYHERVCDLVDTLVQTSGAAPERQPVSLVR